MAPPKIYTNDPEKTKWNNEKFPAALVSIENVTILKLQKDGHL